MVWYGMVTELTSFFSSAIKRGSTVSSSSGTCTGSGDGDGDFFAGSGDGDGEAAAAAPPFFFASNAAFLPGGGDGDGGGGDGDEDNEADGTGLALVSCGGNLIGKCDGICKKNTLDDTLSDRISSNQFAAGNGGYDADIGAYNDCFTFT